MQNVHFSLPRWIEQAVRFGAVGLLNTGLDLSLYIILTRFLPFFETMPVAAKSLSYGVGVLNSFFLNRHWTFRSRVNAGRSLPLFYALNLIGLGINTMILHICLQILALPELVSLSIATTGSLIWNFTTSKIIIFH